MVVNKSWNLWRPSRMLCALDCVNDCSLCFSAAWRRQKKIHPSSSEISAHKVFLFIRRRKHLICQLHATKSLFFLRSLANLSSIWSVLSLINKNLCVCAGNKRIATLAGTLKSRSIWKRQLRRHKTKFNYIKTLIKQEASFNVLFSLWRWS